MKLVTVILLAPFLLLAVPVVGRERMELNPVSRVVNMLKDLETKLEEEADTEKDLYQKFVCWSQTTVTEKTSAVARAQERIASLQTYISDITAGKLAFTTDKEKFEDDLAAVTAELQNLTAERKEEHAKFEVQNADMNEAIDGLKEVIKTLEESTSLSATKTTQLSLLGLRGASSGALARRKHVALLREGLKISDEYMSKSNRHFLHRIFGGKAASVGTLATDESASSAKARSTNVVDSLEDVESSFEKDLKEDEEAEKSAEKNYEKASALKAEQKETAAALLAKLEAEHAARAKATEDSQEEIEALTKQVASDEKLTSEVEKALEDKQKEFDERSQYRLGEIQAVGEAISMLSSDDSRDLFAESFSFVQISSVSTQETRSASKALLSAYGASKDRRIMSLNALLHGAHEESDDKGAFDQVVGKIDEMIAVLKAEEESDLKKKDDCEANKDRDEAEKKVIERSIEDLQTTVKYSQEKISEISGEIKAKQDQIADTDAQLAKALEVRTAEAAEYNAASQDDQAAMTLLQQAAKKMQDFYDTQKAKKSFLLQRDSHRTSADPSEAPKTWSGGYGGAGSQATGVVQTMQMLADDLQKEMDVAKKEESEAVALYKETTKELEDQKADLNAAIDQLEESRGDKESDKQAATKDEAVKTSSLGALVQTMKDVAPECNYFVENFEKRSQNRMTEANGLKQAKAILASSEKKSTEKGTEKVAGP